MSTVQRLKNRAKNPTQPNSSVTTQSSNRTIQQSQPKLRQKYDSNKHSQQKQKQYEAYYQLSQCNPQGITYTHSLFPHNAEMFNNYSVPLGFVFSPLIALDNQQAQVMNKSGDKIPRCDTCRAYMNCYNKIQKNMFTCFLCNRQNNLPKDYNPKDPANQQFNSSIYQAISPTNFYQKQPAQQTFVFMIDITPESANTKMLYYAISAMKQVFSRPQLDDLCIYFFTFDELVQEYDFSGSDIKCVINDQSIQGQASIKLESYLLKDIREKLFQLLDALQQISQNNPRRGSNFYKCFSFIFNALKHTSAKFFILQSNQLIAGEQIFKQEPIKKPNQTVNPNQKIQSLYQTKNKQFFQKFANPMLENYCSISFFTLSRNYKNLKAIHDVLKLSSSEIKVYTKDSAVQLEKFYYDFMYMLGATYFKNIRLDCIISAGWHFMAVYGNFYRLKEYITFQMNWFEQSRKIFVLVGPNVNIENPPPFCALQFTTNYQYKRQCYMSIATIIQPVTGYMDRLYKSIDPICASSALAKGFLSSLRMEQINSVRKKLVQSSSSIYLNALQFHKKAQNIPDSIISLTMFSLALLKSIHSQPETIQNTITFDKIISERNLLQFSAINDIYNSFNPYLFDLVNMDHTMCRQDQQFVYPNSIQPRFHNVREGLFLLDAGTALYLFIAKQCDQNLLVDVLGKPKFQKNDQITQQMVMSQTSFKAKQVQTLIKLLRQQKSYGWVPLHIIRCGENTLNQRNFYLFFYGQKYDEYRAYKMTLQQFIAMISKPNSF